MKHDGQDAAYYEANKDNPDLWGDPDEPTPTKRRSGLAASITVRFSEDEAEAIRRLAQETHMTYSEIVRKAVLVFTRPRFTIENGLVFNPFNQPNTATAASGRGATPRFEDQNRTVTGFSAQPTPTLG